MQSWDSGYPPVFFAVSHKGAKLSGAVFNCSNSLGRKVIEQFKNIPTERKPLIWFLSLGFGVQLLFSLFNRVFEHVGDRSKRHAEVFRDVPIASAFALHAVCLGNLQFLIWRLRPSTLIARFVVAEAACEAWRVC